jgi:hypothetical protein
VSQARLQAAGFNSAAFVWAIRAAEILMRDFLLAPYYLERGYSFEEALERGSRDLGSAKWDTAFRLVAKRYGPFEPALTKSGEDAWLVWREDYVRRRNQLVHDNAVREADSGEAMEVLAFADQIAEWYAMCLPIVVVERRSMYRSASRSLCHFSCSAWRLWRKTMDGTPMATPALRVAVTAAASTVQHSPSRPDGNRVWVVRQGDRDALQP